MVFCVGMYRACSTWQYGVASQVLERSGQVERLGFIWGGDFDRKVDVQTLGEGRAVLKSHDAHPRFAEELAAGRAVGLYSHRDLRDVVFSWIHKTGSTFEELAERGFFDLCLENDRFWRSQPGMLVQSYAHVTGEPARGVAEIAAQLGIELAEGEAREIADSLSFEANRERTRAIAEQLRASGQEPSSKDQSRFDPVSLLHWNHLREGRTGGWRDLATPEQVGLMAHYFGPWLVAHGYEADDSWARGSATDRARRGIERTSHAPNREDILLDRIFRGRKGTYLDIDAPDPVRLNKTFFFYQRGWRGVNLGTGEATRDRFVEDRPADLNLAARLPYAPTTRESDDGPQIRTVASLIVEHQISPADVVALSTPDDPGPVLADLPLETWRPAVIAIESGGALRDPEAYRRWEPRLLDQGYLPAASAGPTRIYLRADLEAELPKLGVPINLADNYVPADPPAPDRETRPSGSEASSPASDEVGSEASGPASDEVESGREGPPVEDRRLEDERGLWEAERAALVAAELARAAEVDRLEFELAHEREAANDLVEYLRAEQGRSQAARHDLESRLARASEESARLSEAVEAGDRALVEAQRALRPYRAVDRFDLLGSIHRRWETLKRLLAPPAPGGPKGPRTGQHVNK